MRTKIALAALAVVGLSLTACLPLAKHPASDPNQAQPEDRLSGVWLLRSPTADRQYVHIGREQQRALDPARSEIEPGLMRFWMISHQTSEGRLSEPFTMQFFCTHLGERHFANLAVPPEGAGPLSRVKPQGYWIINYELDGDRLDVRLMDLEVAASLVESGRLAGQVEREPEKNRVTRVTIDSSTGQLAEFLSVTDLDRLFPKERASIYDRVR